MNTQTRSLIRAMIKTKFEFVPQLAQSYRKLEIATSLACAAANDYSAAWEKGLREDDLLRRKNRAEAQLHRLVMK